MDMLVKLYALPDSRPAYDRLLKAGIVMRRALAPEKHKVTGWVRQNFSEAWASEADVGFACHDATCPNFFGPTGVDPKLRNGGVGKALLFACLEAMRHQGFGYAIIGGVGPAEFYTKAVGAVAIAGSEPGIYRGLL
jgi:GNAT superfamily N-acetyltransferase